MTPKLLHDFEFDGIVPFQICNTLLDKMVNLVLVTKADVGRDDVVLRIDKRKGSWHNMLKERSLKAGGIRI